MIPISLLAPALVECLVSMAQLSCSPANFPFSEGAGGLCKEPGWTPVPSSSSLWPWDMTPPSWERGSPFQPVPEGQ